MALTLAFGLALGAAAIALLIGWLAWGRPLGLLRAECDGIRADRDRRLDQHSQAVAALKAAEERASQLEPLRHELAEVRTDRGRLAEKLAALEAAQSEREQAFEAQLVQIREMREQLTQQFEQLAGAALRQSQAQFLEVANETFAKHRQAAGEGLEKNKAELAQLIEPMRDQLKRYEEGLRQVETARTEAYGALQGQIVALREGQQQVRTETAKLVNALRTSPKMRGRWGEQQLRNVLELAGLSEHADFRTEVSVDVDDGKLRPDVVINLPGGRVLVVDAKCSFNAYLDAVDAVEDGVRLGHLSAHARALKTHAEQLGRKAYWGEFRDAIDFVVMFIPGENFLAAALEHDPELWEYAFGRQVLMATPTNLIALARTVAQVWRQEKLADEARRIGELARELYKRMTVMGDHVVRVGNGLEGAVKSYNEFVGSLEHSVLPQARRFLDLNVDGGKRDLKMLEPVEIAVREPVKGRDLSFTPAVAGPEVKAAE